MQEVSGSTPLSSTIASPKHRTVFGGDGHLPPFSKPRYIMTFVMIPAS